MTSFLTDAGYGALIIFAFIQACCIPISSEIVFGFAGFLASQGKLSLALVILIGSLGEVAGSSTAYGLGRLGGRRMIERYRKYLLMTRKDVERAERFFDGRGSWVVAVGRVIPLIRAFAGLVSGFMEVPFLQFEAFNVLGTVVWASALSSIGYALGSSWHTASKHVSEASDALAALAILMLIVLIAYKAVEMRKERRAEAAAGESNATGGLGPTSAAATGAADRQPHSHRRQSGSPN
jgi:membrane protein DedA with SNARE-associated domain